MTHAPAAVNGHHAATATSVPGSWEGWVQLGRYRLDEQVGQGGMAVVWRGFDTQLKRTVAVKVLHPHLHGREEIRRRFAREAHAVARLHHPHILDVYDSSDPAAEPSWLVMEFVRGTNLRAFGDAHAFDPPELAAACLIPVCDALEHAHQSGVIHRDLKPENVMVRDDGTVKLTDFGIAAIVEPDEKFTATGQILGSPAHLSPEIIEGKPATPQSDLFSLGTMLYWLSCGKLPFLAPTPAALLRLILECKPTDPRMIRPSVGDAQARLIARCIAKDPAARPSSAAELSKELTAMLVAAGLDRPREELTAFVRTSPPEAYARDLRARLVARAVKAGEESLAARKTTQALASFSRALSLDPANAVAKERVERIHHRARRARLLRRGAMGASLAVLVGVGGTQAPSLWRKVVSPPRLAGPSATQPGPQAPTGPAAPTGALAARPDAGPASAPTPAERPESPDVETASDGPGEEDESPPGPRELPAAEEPPRKRRDLAHVTTAEKPLEAKLIPVTIRINLPAQLMIDGKDYGVEQEFSVSLARGQHTALIHKDEFEDRRHVIDVRENMDTVRLQLGAPKAALVSVSGASADLTVKIDGALLGTVGDLLRRPARVAMIDNKVHRDVEITVGDRAYKWKLKAGQQQTFDLAKHGGGQ